MYWRSLTFLDPLAAMLLFVRPRVGVIATVLIISTDVGHNLGFFERFHLALNWRVGAQIAFRVFVVATLPMLWRALNSRPSK